MKLIKVLFLIKLFLEIDLEINIWYTNLKQYIVIYGAGLFETASESCIHGVYHVVIYDDNKNDINELKRLISDIKREKAPYIYTVDGKIVERNTEQTIEYLKSMEEYKKDNVPKTLSQFLCNSICDEVINEFER